MTREEFFAATRKAGIDDRSFSLDGGLPSEQYVLSPEGGNRWSVYYSERGNRTSLRIFNEESDALEHLLAVLLHDPSTRTSSWPTLVKPSSTC